MEREQRLADEHMALDGNWEWGESVCLKRPRQVSAIVSAMVSAIVSSIVSSLVSRPRL